ncbi:MAG: 1,2-phenylacetyl-CoA epoxidase subunit PaaE [Pseudomonadota bacterium]
MSLNHDFHELTVAGVHRDTAESVRVTFELPEELADTFAFIQGQHLTLRKQMNGEELRRNYSLCTPVEGDLTIAIREVQDGRFSSWANSELKAGDTLDVMAPQGRFFTELKADQKKRYLALAAGSGITPIASIIATALETEPASHFTLVYGNRRTNTIMLRPQLEHLKNRYLDRFHVIHLLSREAREAEILNGRVTPEKLAELGEHLVNFDTFDEAYLCGPQAMILSAKDWLAEYTALDAKQIHLELFGTEVQSTAVHADSGKDQGPVRKVSIIADRRRTEIEVPADGVPILDAALAAGADLPFACKGGVCCTCRAKVVEGEVRMDVNYALDPEEVEQGFILTCQSHPTTDHVVVDFDHA